MTTHSSKINRFFFYRFFFFWSWQVLNLIHWSRAIKRLYLNFKTPRVFLNISLSLSLVLWVRVHTHQYPNRYVPYPQLTHINKTALICEWGGDSCQAMDEIGFLGLEKCPVVLAPFNQLRRKTVSSACQSIHSKRKWLSENNSSHFPPHLWLKGHKNISSMKS